jgi:hypothetical protein
MNGMIESDRSGGSEAEAHDDLILAKGAVVADGFDQILTVSIDVRGFGQAEGQDFEFLAVGEDFHFDMAFEPMPQGAQDAGLVEITEQAEKTLDTFLRVAIAQEQLPQIKNQVRSDRGSGDYSAEECFQLCVRHERNIILMRIIRNKIFYSARCSRTVR